MTDNRFRFEIRQLGNYQFQMNWDLAGIEPLLTDEPAPLGTGRVRDNKVVLIKSA